MVDQGKGGSVMTALLCIVIGLLAFIAGVVLGGELEEWYARKRLRGRVRR